MPLSFRAELFFLTVSQATLYIFTLYIILNNVSYFIKNLIYNLDISVNFIANCFSYLLTGGSNGAFK